MFFSNSPTCTASRLSTMMKLLSPSIIRLSRLFAWRPCTTKLTGQPPSFCWFAQSLSTLIKWSQILAVQGCAQNTFASRRPVLSCVTDTLFGDFQLYWHRRPHTTNCIASSPVQKRPTKCSLPAGIGGSEGIRMAKLPRPDLRLAR